MWQVTSLQNVQLYHKHNGDMYIKALQGENRCPTSSRGATA